jgi:hypothetical protein
MLAQLGTAKVWEATPLAEVLEDWRRPFAIESHR